MNAEDIALSVGAALKGLPHRITYRSALHEHDLVVHPARSIHVATDRRVRTRTLSGRPLRIVIEPPEALGVGRVPWGSSSLSDRHRAVLDAAQRPRLVGGLEVLAEAFAAAPPSCAPTSSWNTLAGWAGLVGGPPAARLAGRCSGTGATRGWAGAHQAHHRGPRPRARNGRAHGLEGWPMARAMAANHR